MKVRDDLLGRIDALVGESERTRLAVKVDALMESAAPGIPSECEHNMCLCGECPEFVGLFSVVLDEWAENEHDLDALRWQIDLLGEHDVQVGYVPVADDGGGARVRSARKVLRRMQSYAAEAAS